MGHGSSCLDPATGERSCDSACAWGCLRHPGGHQAGPEVRDVDETVIATLRYDTPRECRWPWLPLDPISAGQEEAGRHRGIACARPTGVRQVAARASTGGGGPSWAPTPDLGR